MTPQQIRTILNELPAQPKTTEIHLRSATLTFSKRNVNGMLNVSFKKQRAIRKKTVAANLALTQSECLLLLQGLNDLRAGNTNSFNLAKKGFSIRRNSGAGFLLQKDREVILHLKADSLLSIQRATEELLDRNYQGVVRILTVG